MPASPRLPVSLVVAICSSLHTAGAECVVIKSFGASNQEGTRPRGTLVEAAGTLYGTTHTGGAFGRGTVFRVNVDGTGFQTLHSFNPANRGGHAPEAGLILGSDGTLYGTTAASGTGLSGTIFSLGTNGTGHKVLRDLDGPKDGREPRTRLMEGSDGLLYGVATVGGPSGGGTVFRLKTDGSDFKVLHAFKLAASEGTTPLAELIEAEDALYGTTAGGGNGQSGVIFKLNRDGSAFKVLHRFGADGNDGRIPNDPLLEIDGVLYGTTSAGGPAGSGTIYTLKPDGANYKVLYYFNLEHREPKGLIRYKDSLMGTATGGMFRGGIIFQYSFDGIYSVVHQFGRLGLNSAANDGSVPAASLIITEDGKIYGATEGGGAFAQGTVFRFN